jgi:folylpolyglutamate synthase/dihydropteroate synthase
MGNYKTLHVSQQEDLNSLNVLHVTGTKGKGSTCAFVDSILRHTKPDWKIGELHWTRFAIFETQASV